MNTNPCIAIIYCPPVFKFIHLIVWKILYKRFLFVSKWPLWLSTFDPVTLSMKSSPCHMVCKNTSAIWPHGLKIQNSFINPNPIGGGGGPPRPPPLDDSRDNSRTRRTTAAPFADFFLSSLAQLLRPNLSHPRIPFLSHAPSKNFRQPQNC